MINRDDLLRSYESGDFLKAIRDAYLANDNEHDKLALVAELVNLHNKRIIDIVGAFESLSENFSGPDFFLTRNIFEKALPNIDVPVQPIMHCVLQLYWGAGQDLAAGTIINAFIAFCVKEPSRPREALKEIEANPDRFADLLPAVLIAGSRVDHSLFIAEAIRLCEDKNVKLRRGAVFSIGSLNRPESSALLDSTLSVLEHSAEIETDDQILANIVMSAFTLLQREKSQESRIVTLFGLVLYKGGESTLHAASRVFGLYTEKLPETLIDLFLIHLVHVKPVNKGTVDNIDYGISHLTVKSAPGRVIKFLEGLLLAYPKELTMEHLDSTARKIISNTSLINKILTRWFLCGDRVLCEAVQTIVNTHHGNDLMLEIDPSELKPADFIHNIFMARKAIGYLFMQPISAASILVSLMRHTTDNEVLTELGALLFNPLLLNYTGKVRSYVAQQSELESKKVKKILDKAIKKVDVYLDNLRSVGNLNAIHPSEAQREAYHRHFSHLMTESMKKAEAQSVFLNLVPKKVLLYGRKSINYVYSSNGHFHRMEMPLQGHEIEIESPRMALLDPLGLDYILRVFRNERIVEVEAHSKTIS